MKINRYRLQTAAMESGKGYRNIAREAHMDVPTLLRIEREGVCSHHQRNALAKAVDVDPSELMMEDF